MLIIAAHGNSLRALVMYLDNVSESEIVELNIPTGIPLVYELDDDLEPLRHYYLGDPTPRPTPPPRASRIGQVTELGAWAGIETTGRRALRAKDRPSRPSNF